jgi:hypothetical protein
MPTGMLAHPLRGRRRCAVGGRLLINGIAISWAASQSYRLLKQCNLGIGYHVVSIKLACRRCMFETLQRLVPMPLYDFVVAICAVSSYSNMYRIPLVVLLSEYRVAPWGYCQGLMRRCS